MKFTHRWLLEHLETNASLDEICRTLTAIGLEVEQAHDQAKLLAPFTVAHIDSTVQHPNADRLKVCTVDTGTEKLQIVCGAPNARAGIKVVLSRPGDFIPGLNITLGASKIRDVESQGMLCAADELGIGDDHDGIMELPASAPLGVRFIDVMPHYADASIEINLTPNRGDCAGVRGIARDLAAAGLGTLKAVATPNVPVSGPCPYQVVLENEADCPAFALRLIKGVKNGPSPAWLQQKLLAVGITPISALVDVTNYFCLNQARPLHVFDAAKLNGQNLTVRRARAGETLAALNNKTYTLTADHLAIADEAGVISLAGVMGGATTGCSDSTTDVLLEVALFNPAAVAATGRSLQINSDARYRFERGLDGAALLADADAATTLILQLCGGSASALTLAGTVPTNQPDILYFPDHVKTLGGVDVPAEKQLALFQALGCHAHTHGDHFHVAPPSWRHDLTQAPDLVEEVLRLTGYHTIAATPLPNQHMITALSAPQKRGLALRRIMAGRGLHECITFSFMAADVAAHIVPELNPSLRLLNPISTALDYMRPSIIPNLLQAAAANSARGYHQAALFELGPVFNGVTPSDEEMVATGLRVGKMPRHWQQAPTTPDVFSVKADVLALLASCGLNPETLPITAEAPRYYHPGRSGVVRLGQTIVATFGELHPNVLRACDCDTSATGSAVAFEVFVDRLPASKAKGHAKPLLQLPPLMAVKRDFAFLAATDVSAAALTKAVKGVDKARITDVSVFDVYSGDKIAAGQKSLALAVTLQPLGDKAFSEAELEQISQNIINAAAKIGANLR